MHEHVSAIIDEWKDNPDGGVVMCFNDGVLIDMLKTMNRDSLVRFIRSSVADEYIVHLRAATGSNISITSTHGFVSPCGEWLYVHNGVIRGSQQYVDSLEIGEYLSDYFERNEPGTLPDEWWAMVLAYNVITNDLWLHTSANGSLYWNESTGDVSTHAITGVGVRRVGMGWERLSNRTNPKLMKSIGGFGEYIPPEWVYRPSKPTKAKPPKLSEASPYSILRCQDCGYTFDEYGKGTQDDRDFGQCPKCRGKLI